MEITMQKELVKNLSRAVPATNGTTLITLMIPPNYSLALTTDKLKSEMSDSSNIKDKTVRKAVLSSLKSAVISLKSYGHSLAPNNGLVLCAGETTCRS